MDQSTPSHAHEPPPAAMRAVHKRYSKLPFSEIPSDPNILDFNNISKKHEQLLRITRRIPRHSLERIFRIFNMGEKGQSEGGNCVDNISISSLGVDLCSDDILVYEHEYLPGFEIIPNLCPVATQLALLNRLWLRDLSNPRHNTNLNLHYEIPYMALNDPEHSFFHLNSPEKQFLLPKDPSVHKPLSITQMLNKKLRWMTLGGQYDWTRKVYPEMDSKGGKPEHFVSFPEDIATLIHSIFPNICPQAAIANLYTPGDQLSPHRDVSEASSAPLASISIGADAIFVIGLDPKSSNLDTLVEQEEDRNLVMRIRSGDVVLMGGKSRWAWHSVPKILATSVDPKIEKWPGGSDTGIGVGSPWLEWMKNRRINLNVRQMWD